MLPPIKSSMAKQNLRKLGSEFKILKRKAPQISTKGEQNNSSNNKFLES